MTMRCPTRPLLALAALVGLASLLAGCGPTVPVGKPAIRQTPVAPHVWDDADPFVLNADGQLFLFGSSNNKRVPVRRITDLGESLAASKQYWDSQSGSSTANNAMWSRPAWVDASEPDIWAPTVAKFEDRYVMFFAGHRAGATDEFNDLCIGRAISSTPAGPYSPEASPVYCGLKKVDAGANPWGHGALDPEVVRAPTGKFYLLVALSRTNGNIGVVGLSGTGAVVGGINATPTVLASQSSSIPWHDGTDDGRFTGSTFLENPSMVYDAKTKTYLLFYSAGQWNTSRYLTGFARCAAPTGPCTLDTRGPFLKGNGTRSGTGGLTVFKDARGRLVAAYSSWTAGHELPASNPTGAYSRQVSWELLVINGTDPATQTISLQ